MARLAHLEGIEGVLKKDVNKLLICNKVYPNLALDCKQLNILYWMHGMFL